MTGRYEVRREVRLGVPVLAIYWVTPGEPPTLLAAVGTEARLRLLAEALDGYLRGQPDQRV